MIIGIDPGKSGGVAVLKPSGVVESTCKMPHRTVGHMKEFDHEALKRYLFQFDMKHATIFLERSMPIAMGRVSAFNYGMDFGMLVYTLRDVGARVYQIEPVKWVKVMHQGIDSRLQPKARSHIALERLFPEPIRNEFIPRLKSGRYHDGVMDAILIAEYGRSWFAKGMVPADPLAQSQEQL